MNKKYIKTTSLITTSAGIGALMSYFFGKFLDKYSFPLSFILVIIYTLFVFLVTYLYVKKLN